MLIKVK